MQRRGAGCSGWGGRLPGRRHADPAAACNSAGRPGTPQHVWQADWARACCHTLSETSFHTMTLLSNEAVASRLPNLGWAQATCAARGCGAGRAGVANRMPPACSATNDPSSRGRAILCSMQGWACPRNSQRMRARLQLSLCVLQGPAHLPHGALVARKVCKVGHLRPGGWAAWAVNVAATAARPQPCLPPQRASQQHVRAAAPARSGQHLGAGSPCGQRPSFGNHQAAPSASGTTNPAGSTQHHNQSSSTTIQQAGPPGPPPHQTPLHIGRWRLWPAACRSNQRRHRAPAGRKRGRRQSPALSRALGARCAAVACGAAWDRGGGGGGGWEGGTAACHQLQQAHAACGALQAQQRLLH